MAICLVHGPVCEALADKVQATDDVTNISPLIMDKHFSKSIKELEDKLDDKSGTLTTAMSTLTDQRHEATMVTITHHSTNL